MTATDGDTTILALRERVSAFVRERDWEQFHQPKDLAAAIAIEAGELLERFLWRTPAEVEAVARRPEARGPIADELADVVIYCLSLANRLELDVTTAVGAKLAANEARYPARLVRGRADKYTHYPDEPGDR